MEIIFQRNFLAKNFFDPNYFSDQELIPTKKMPTKNVSDQKCFRPKSFLTKFLAAMSSSRSDIVTTSVRPSPYFSFFPHLTIRLSNMSKLQKIFRIKTNLFTEFITIISSLSYNLDGGMISAMLLSLLMMINELRHTK